MPQLYVSDSEMYRVTVAVLSAVRVDTFKLIPDYVRKRISLIRLSTCGYGTDWSNVRRSSTAT
jgi:hypothetical protein